MKKKVQEIPSHLLHHNVDLKIVFKCSIKLHHIFVSRECFQNPHLSLHILHFNWKLHLCKCKISSNEFSKFHEEHGLTKCHNTVCKLGGPPGGCFIHDINTMSPSNVLVFLNLLDPNCALKYALLKEATRIYEIMHFAMY